MWIVNNNVGACVLVDGEPLVEHQTTVLDGNTTTCYIEAQEGKQYAVQVDNQAYEGTNLDFLNVALYIDGKWQRTHVMRTLGVRYLTGWRVSSDSEQPFVFDRAISSGEDPEGPEETEKNLLRAGSIEIQYWKMRKLGTKTRSTPYTMREQSLPCGTSKAVAMLTHTTGFDTPVPAAQEGLKTISTKLDDSPYATLIFKYRSRECMNYGIKKEEMADLTQADADELQSPASQAQIPNQPSQTQSQQIIAATSTIPCDDEPDEDEDEDEDAFFKRLKNTSKRQRAAVLALLDGTHDDDESPRKRVKREVKAEEVKREQVNIPPGTVIDLTD
ncbi:hypothetical protein HK104_000478 [Borealophlyctis nickersoniae]|nr:hypothetical protein HK104_000478 [Borealophlyctis nickersoniae]